MTLGTAKWWARKKVHAGAVLIALPALGFVAFRMASSTVEVPTAEVKWKEFIDTLEIKGEVKAVRSVVIAAPYSAGDLQITNLVPNFTRVKKGDVIVEFDTTTVKQKLGQDQSSAKSAEAEINQSRAAAKLKEEQDVTDVMKAKFDAEKARIDATKQEILSKIEGAQGKLKVTDAEQKLKEAEAKLKADRTSAAADLASKEQKLNQAKFQVQQDERSLSLLTLRAPLEGVVALQNNWQPQSGPAPFRAGDRAWPGAAIAELPDATSLKIAARVEEGERGQLKVNQAATVRIDALPDRTFESKLDTISPTASMDFGGGWPIQRNFAVELSLTDSDARLAPGMSATVRVAVARIPHGVVIPSSALFRKAGQTIAYVRRGSTFDETPVEVTRRSPEEVLISKGVKPGDQVATKDPTLAR